MDTTIIIVILIVICCCFVILLLTGGIIYKTTSDTPDTTPTPTSTSTPTPTPTSTSTPTPTPTSTSTPTPTPTSTTPTPTPTIPSNFSFKQNNGSVSGDTYCRGSWESSNGKNKNLKCKGGKSTVDNSDINCTDVYAHGNLAYDCSDELFSYKGNNGSVSGNEYCRGSYENNGVDKNQKCEGGINTSDNLDINCIQTYKHGNLAYKCGRGLSLPEAQAVLRQTDFINFFRR